MPKKRRQNKDRGPRQIQSDDEVSDSEPMDAIDQFHQKVDHESESDGDSEPNEYEVAAVANRSDSEEEDDEEEDDEFEEHEVVNNTSGIPSRDAFGKNLWHTDGTAKQIRKKKKDEQAEIKELEEEDADERRNDLNDFLNVHVQDDSDDDSADDADGTPVAEVSLADLSEIEKIKLLKRQSPLLFPLIAEYKLFSDELTNVLSPLKAHLNDADERFKTYVVNRTRTIRTYLINIAFYLRLRAKANPNLEEHPVVDRLTKLRRIIEKISSDKAQDYTIAYLESSVQNNVESMKKLKDGESLGNDESAVGEEDDAESDMEEDQPAGEVDTKRKITYKIAKNKGLRKKGQKKRANPRVKNRLAYESAQKRRKGAVRTVVTETKKYTGEASGIRAGIKKSVRIRS